MPISPHLRFLYTQATNINRGSVVAADPVFRFGEVAVDRQAQLVRRSGAEVHLMPIEYRLMSVLMANAGRVLTQRQLLREVWGPAYAEQNHYLRIYMATCGKSSKPIRPSRSTC